MRVNSFSDVTSPFRTPRGMGSFLRLLIVFFFSVRTKAHPHQQPLRVAGRPVSETGVCVRRPAWGRPSQGPPGCAGLERKGVFTSKSGMCLNLRVRGRQVARLNRKQER